MSTSNDHQPENTIKYFNESVDHILFSLNPIKLSKLHHSQVLLKVLEIVLIKDMLSAAYQANDAAQAFEEQSKILLGGMEEIKAQLLKSYKQLQH